MQTKHFKIATYNVNSVRVRLPVILDWLAREQPDVLCLQETKVQDQDFPAQAIREAGYHVIFRGQKYSAGVAILSRAEPQAVAYGFDDGGEPDVPRLIRAQIGGIQVVNTYVPQGRSPESEHFQYKLAWFGRLRRFFAHHFTPQEMLLWVGDFNVATEDIDVHSPQKLREHVDFHPAAQKSLELVRRWGFVDVFRQQHPGEPGHYTYWDYRAKNPIERGIGWRIDHIWATEPLARRLTSAWIDVDVRRTARPSDHTLLVAEFEF
ncbi:MAG: exodeoxyribonuclease III [Anaerolineae bacterium]|nr:exodeoxyribonuclease III [Anaerolineae bacterium]